MQRDHDMGQSKGSRVVDNKGRSKGKFKCKCHECGKSGQGMRSERVRSEQERLGRDEIRRHGECRSECAGDWSSVVALEKSPDFECKRIVSRGDCV